MQPNDITPKMRKFAEGVGSGMSKADAYRAAYNAEKSSLNTIGAEITKLCRDPRVAHIIHLAELEAAKKTKVTREWLLRWHMLRATYDASELTALIWGACRCCHGEGHLPQWRWHEYVEKLAEAEREGTPMPDLGGGLGYDATKAPVEGCLGCDGKGVRRTDIPDTRNLSPAAQAAFEGIKQTRDGLEIKMADKAQAAEAVAKLCGFNVADMRNPADIPEDSVLAALTAEQAARVYREVLGMGGKAH